MVRALNNVLIWVFCVVLSTLVVGLSDASAADKGVVKRNLYLKLPLQGQKYHWVFLGRKTYFKNTDVSLEVFDAKDMTRLKYHFDLISDGRLSKQWELIDDDKHRLDDEAYFGFVSRQQYDFSPADYVKLRLVARKDLSGIGPDETGVLEAGEYLSFGSFSIFDEEVYDAGPDECVFLEGDELSPHWKMRITAQKGWMD